MSSTESTSCFSSNPQLFPLLESPSDFETFVPPSLDSGGANDAVYLLVASSNGASDSISSSTQDSLPAFGQALDSVPLSPNSLVDSDLPSVSSSSILSQAIAYARIFPEDGRIEDLFDSHPNDDLPLSNPTSPRSNTSQLPLARSSPNDALDPAGESIPNAPGDRNEVDDDEPPHSRNCQCVARRSKNPLHGRNPTYARCRFRKCAHIFACVDALKRHARGHSANRKLISESNRNFSKALEAEDERLRCPVCRKTFGLPQHLNEHVRAHLSGRNFRCETCALVFLGEAELNRHRIDVHSSGQVRVFRCDSCSKTYVRRDLLTKHRLKVHQEASEPSKRFVCGRCDYVAFTENAMKDHVSKNHSPKTQQRPSLNGCRKRPTYSCQICHQNFNWKSVLNHHMKTHFL